MLIFNLYNKYECKSNWLSIKTCINCIYHIFLFFLFLNNHFKTEKVIKENKINKGNSGKLKYLNIINAFKTYWVNMKFPILKKWNMKLPQNYTCLFTLLSLLLVFVFKKINEFVHSLLLITNKGTTTIPFAGTNQELDLVWLGILSRTN